VNFSLSSIHVGVLISGSLAWKNRFVQIILLLVAFESQIVIGKSKNVIHI
jgi:hypothetical protein